MKTPLKQILLQHEQNMDQDLAAEYLIMLI